MRRQQSTWDIVIVNMFKHRQMKPETVILSTSFTDQQLSHFHFAESLYPTRDELEQDQSIRMLTLEELSTTLL